MLGGAVVLAILGAIFVLGRAGAVLGRGGWGLELVTVVVDVVGDPIVGGMVGVGVLHLGLQVSSWGHRFRAICSAVHFPENWL